MMYPQLRLALKICGLRPADVEVKRKGKHPYIVINGRRVSFAASPKNVDHTAFNIARDIQMILSGKRQEQHHGTR